MGCTPEPAVAPSPAVNACKMERINYGGVAYYTLTYDAQHRISAYTTNNGGFVIATKMTYNNNGLISEESYNSSGGVSGSTTNNFSFEYDANNYPTKRTYTSQSGNTSIFDAIYHCH